MNVIDWLLDSDPAIRWQVMRDLTDAPADEVAAERARVDPRGMGRAAARAPGRRRHVERRRLLPGVDVDDGDAPAALRSSASTRRATKRARRSRRVRAAARWEYDENLRFFDGEVEPCINGQAVAIGSYFGQDVRGIVDRLLTEQMDDGGWNCEQERGSTRGSFDTTINVLEGLLEYERATGRRPATSLPPASAARSICSSDVCSGALSDGEIGTESWLNFGVPDALALRRRCAPSTTSAIAGAKPDERMAEAIELVESKRDAEGRWPLDHALPRGAARRPR